MMEVTEKIIPGGGRAKSCVNCRQVKLLCDARHTYPNPCTRCQMKSVDCGFAANFKRVPVRKMVQEFTTPPINLQASPGKCESKQSVYMALPLDDTTSKVSSGEDITASSYTSPGLQSHSSTGHERKDSHCRTETETNAWLQANGEKTDSWFCLETIALSYDTVATLLSHFEQFYLPHLPILTPITSIRTFANDSPLLFWTVMQVASARHVEYNSIHNDLVPVVDRLLTPTLTKAMNSISNLHAILISCCWPTLRVRQSDDPSWNYIGLAINGAKQLGFHQPFMDMQSSIRWISPGDESVEAATATIKAKTWLACFDINTRISNDLGLPSNLCSPKDLRNIENIRQQLSGVYEEDMLAHTETMMVIANFNTQLDDVKDHDVLHSLMGIFENQLNDIKSKYQHLLKPSLKIVAEGASLYLYALYLITEVPQEPQKLSRYTTYRGVMLAKALSSATKLIDAVTSIGLFDSSDSNKSEHSGLFFKAMDLLYYPKWYFTMTFFAAVFLLKLVTFPEFRSQDGLDLVSQGIGKAHALFQAFSFGRDHKRGLIILEGLGQIVRDYPLWKPELLVNNRLGASLQYDARLRVAMWRNINPISGQLGPMKTWTTLTDGHFLPFTPEQIVALQEMQKSACGDSSMSDSNSDVQRESTVFDWISSMNPDTQQQDMGYQST